MTASATIAAPFLNRTTRLIVEATIFAVTAALGYSFRTEPGAPAVWWPATGAFIAWLLSRPRREWPMVLAVGATIRIMLAAVNGLSVEVTAWILIGSLMNAVASALVLRALLGQRRPFSEPYDIVGFGAVALLLTGPMASAMVAWYRSAVTSVALNWMSPVDWSLGESVGVLLIGPFLLTIGDAYTWWQSNGWGRRAELFLMLVLTVACALWALDSPQADSPLQRPVIGLLALPSVWAALRFGLFAVSWMQLLIGVIGGWGLVSGVGVFMALRMTHERHVLLFQVYSLMMALPTMLIAAAFESQRRALSKARESESQFRRLVDNAPVALLVERDDAPDRPYVNPRLAALLGPVERTEGIEGWWDRTGVMPAVRVALDQAAARSAEAAAPPVTTDLLGIDGSPRQMELSVSVAGDRRITAFVDLTDRVRLEAELRQAHKLEALGTLAGGVAHDFNNLLAAVLGNVDLARRVLPAGLEAGTFLVEAEKAGKRAASVVRQILTFSRREEQARQVIHLGPVLHEAVALLRSAAGAQTQVVVVTSTDVPTVLGDATQLHQLILNLGTNALHAMRKTGGVLTIELAAASVTHSDTKRQPDLREGRYARLVVRDTGQGMSPATLERIFEPFFTTKPVGEGTGLGLAVVHGVVRGHDGSINVQSTRGEGSVFEVLLPAVTTPASVAIIEEVPMPSARGLRVLVVDDEPALARIAERALLRAGCAVRAVLDAASAMELLRAAPDAVDVLVTDLTMPGTSGLELAAEALMLRPGLPILLVSGYSVMITEDDLQAKGISAVLQKPFTTEELARAVMALAPVGSAS